MIAEFGAVGIPGMHGDVAATEDFQAAYSARLGGDLRRARGLGRCPVVLGRLLPSEAFPGQRPVRGLRRGHHRPPAQGGAAALAAIYGGELPKVSDTACDSHPPQANPTIHPVRMPPPQANRPGFPQPESENSKESHLRRPEIRKHE